MGRHTQAVAPRRAEHSCSELALAGSSATIAASESPGKRLADPLIPKKQLAILRCAYVIGYGNLCIQRRAGQTVIRSSQAVTGGMPGSAVTPDPLGEQAAEIFAGQLAVRNGSPRKSANRTKTCARWMPGLPTRH